ncbi:MAG: hypothetical protein H0X03_06630 [Nitrosopumilus sp.]|nr:hypothetical protein [Nitrosopumilus sp.]
MVFSFFTAIGFLTTISYNDKVFAVCNEVNNKNIYCHEQYNTRSNTDTTTTTTTTTTITEEKEQTPLFCTTLACNLSKYL